MDLDALRDAARAALPADAWSFYQGTADGRADFDRDHRAWERLEFVPDTMTSLSVIDPSVVLDGQGFALPLHVAAMAGQGACHPDGEMATARAVASVGALMTYSHNATVSVERFGSAATAPWWAQIYLQRDRGATADYVARAREAGAAALVLTVDVPGSLADAAFRKVPISGPVSIRGNVPPTGGGSGTASESSLSPSDITELAESSGLPVWAKGVLTARDAVRAVDAGATGVIVSNHGRRQLEGVVSTSSVLREVVDAVDGRCPVLVDGGIRSGADVVRALALGAASVGIGRPVLWALAAGGPAAVETMLTTIAEEIVVTLAGVGVGGVADLRPEMVRLSDRG